MPRYDFQCQKCKNLFEKNLSLKGFELCSNCGYKKEELKLSERVYHCESCGFEIDRDLNAAINLKLYTASSAGINAFGEDKVQRKQWSFTKEESNRELALC